MYISYLQQALTADRSKISVGPNPSDWITSYLPLNWNLFSFHFFVDWSISPIVSGTDVWLTRLVRFNENEGPENVNESNLEDLFASTPDANLTKKLGAVCASYTQNLKVVLLPEISVADIQATTPIWTIGYQSNGEFNVKTRSVEALRYEIQRCSGGPVQIGRKGLIYSTSAIEGFLSLTDSAYPGDVDAVIVNDNGVVRCVIEYKKHTLEAPLEDYLVDRYYPRPDGRKYLRLQSLVSAYRGTGNQVPFVIRYYSTKYPAIRLQEISNFLPDGATIARDSLNINVDSASGEDIAKIILEWLEL